MIRYSVYTTNKIIKYNKFEWGLSSGVYIFAQRLERIMSLQGWEKQKQQLNHN